MVYEEMVEHFQVLVKNGLEQERLISLAKQKGANLGECMKLVRKLYGLSLGEAKKVVWASPSWVEETAVSDRIIDVAITLNSDDD